MVITTSSLGMRSSVEMSYTSNPICVRLSSPYFSLIARISSLMTPRSRFLSAKIAFNSPIRFISSSNSFSSFSLSSPVRARRRMSTIACACASESWKRSINSVFASCTVWEPRMILMTSSILSRAMSSPCKIWARSSALFNSYWVLLVMTSS